jgi:FolB domain-containing protein
MDQIFIKDLTARGIIGVHEWERQAPQEIVINIVLYADLHKAGDNDDLGESIDYQSVAEKVLAHAETAHKLTVEGLAADLADLCLKNARVEKVCVKVEKPGAIKFARSVGVQIERERDHGSNIG